MRKKVLKTNQVVARRAEKHINNSAMVAAIPDPEKIVLCLRRFALLVVKKQPYLLSHPAIDQSIAEIASRLEGTAITDKAHTL
jgi:hypothetical protein